MEIEDREKLLPGADGSVRGSCCNSVELLASGGFANVSDWGVSSLVGDAEFTFSADLTSNDEVVEASIRLYLDKCTKLRPTRRAFLHAQDNIKMWVNDTETVQSVFTRPLTCLSHDKLMNYAQINEYYLTQSPRWAVQTVQHKGK